MKRFLLVIALALGLLAASALPAIADEHVAKRSNWPHDRTKVYTRLRSTSTTSTAIYRES
jgi:hypothetical protein